MEINAETLERMAQMCLQGMDNAFKTSLENHQEKAMTIDQFIFWRITSE